MAKKPNAYVVEVVWLRAGLKVQCGECRGDIYPGTTYELQIVQRETRTEAHRTCATCARLREMHAPAAGFGKLLQRLGVKAA